MGGLVVKWLTYSVIGWQWDLTGIWTDLAILRCDSSYHLMMIHRQCQFQRKWESILIISVKRIKLILEWTVSLILMTLFINWVRNWFLHSLITVFLVDFLIALLIIKLLICFSFFKINLVTFIILLLINYLVTENWKR